MAGKNTSAFGIYATRPMVEEAIEHLRKRGLPQRGYLGAVSR